MRLCRNLIALGLPRPVSWPQLRSLHINTCVHASLRWNKTEQFEANDFHDFHHAVAALAYCQFFLTERGLKTRVTARHVALDTLYGCRVAGSVPDAIALLREISAPG
ncbi:MAG: hypothetical protein B7X39_19660 [Lysobacterales bacterium 14-68-21]|nr:MAG: hypothetical protein B7X39_19660 [Xanthomonadales bacterium 14-68-21]